MRQFPSAIDNMVCTDLFKKLSATKLAYAGRV